MSGWQSLYGLKDAPKMWFDSLRKQLFNIGFSEVAHTQCVLQRDNITILVYVDYVLIVAPTEKE